MAGGESEEGKNAMGGSIAGEANVPGSGSRRGRTGSDGSAAACRQAEQQVERQTCRQQGAMNGTPVQAGSGSGSALHQPASPDVGRRRAAGSAGGTPVPGGRWWFQAEANVPATAVKTWRTSRYQ